MRRLGNRLTIVFLTMVMVLGGISGLLMPGGGKAYAAGFAGGSGIQGDPYQIATADQLNEVRNHLGAGNYFKLTANIDLSGYDGNNWLPIGDDSARFQGSMDGNGFKITGLTINKPSSSYIGLFGVVDSNSVITNIMLEGINVLGYSYVGGLVGWSIEGATISNSYAGGSVSVQSDAAGGLVGLNKGTISNSYSTASVSGLQWSVVGGLVGVNLGTISNSYATGDVNGWRSGGLAGGNYSQNSPGTITNSYATGSVNVGDGGSAGLVAYNYNGTVTNSYYDSQTTGKSDTGQGDGKTTVEMQTQTTFSNWDFNSEWYMLPGQYPQLWAFTLAKGTNVGTTKLNRVSSDMEYSLNGGTYTPIAGTSRDNIAVQAGDTISVRTASHVKTVTVGQSDIKGLPTPVLTADTTNNYIVNDTEITFMDDSVWRVAITAVKDGATLLIPGTDYTVDPGKITIKAGVLAKGNHTIEVTASGYEVTGVRQTVKLLPSPVLTADTTGNLTVNPIEITFTDDLVWRLAITAVKDGATLLSPGTDYTVVPGKITIAAGVLAKGNHTITVTVPNYEDAGVSQYVDKLYTGTGAGTLMDPYLITTADQLNDVRDFLDKSFKLTANIDLSPYAANEGWSPIGDDSAGFQGNMDGNGYKITHLTINRPGSDNIGLFGAANANSVINNIKLEDIHVQGQYYVGGLVGFNKGTIRNSYTTAGTGSVSGYQNAGGLVGYNQGTISNSHTTGNVNGFAFVGGLVGQNSGTISNSYATGNVSGSMYLGGLVGLHQGSISNSYATGNVSGSTYAGGLVGHDYYNGISNSFYNSETTGQSDTGKGDGRSSSEMKLESTYTNWDFSLDWYMLTGQYPQLWGTTDITPTAVPTAALVVGTIVGTTRLTGVTNAMEYKVNSGSYNTVTGITYVDNISVDAGDTISVRVAATAQQPRSNNQTLTVGLTDITPSAAPTTAALAVGTNAGTTKLSGVTSTMEYKVNSGSYITITDIFVDNISVNAGDTISVRVKATALQPASYDQTLTVGLANITTAAAPTTAALAVGTNAGTTKLTGVTSAMEYKVNSGSYITITDIFVNNISVNAGDTISVRVKATALQPASNDQMLTVGLAGIQPPAGPTAALAVGTNAGTTKLTGVTSAMEYKVNSGSYNPITGTFVDNISVNAGDTISVRVQATAQQPASIDQTLTVGLADIEPAAAPTTAVLAAGTNVGTTKLSGVTSAMEYSVNGAVYLPITGTYVDNISVNAGDTISVRIQATALQPASIGQTLTVGLADIKPGSSAATLTSTIGTVSAGGTANETITDIPNGTTLAAFKEAITQATNARFEVYEEDGTTVATALATGKKVIVTAQDGTTKVTYTVTVNAPLSANALLSSLAVDQATLTPEFSSSNLNYTVDVTNSVSSLNLSLTKADSNQILSVTGAVYNTVTGNVYSYNANLNMGVNPIQITVMAQNGTSNIYTVNVTRSPAASSNADLSGLMLSSGALSPAFASGTIGYTSSVANGIASLTVTGSVYDSNATMTVNGISVTSGQASGAISLNVGSNLITIVVTAQNGLTKTYTVTVTRAAPESSSGGGGSTTPTNSIVTSTDGTLTLPVGRPGEVSLKKEVTITIPAGATSKELKLTIDKVLNTGPLLTNKDVLASPIFEILKNFTENFSKPVTLTFSFDPTKLSGDQRATVFYYDEAKKGWVEVPGGKVNADTITVQVDHFTKYAVFVVGQAAEVPVKPNLNFSDIAGHWAEANIKQAVSGGIVTGYPDGTFKPNQTVTRAEFAVMLMNTLKPKGEAGALTFTDNVKIGAWAQKAVAQAVQAGIINGYENGSFGPDAQITRAEMAVMVARALGQSSEANAATDFADDKDIPAWAKASVAYVKRDGIVQGKGDNQFAPQDHATRAEAVTILLNMLALKIK